MFYIATALIAIIGFASIAFIVVVGVAVFLPDPADEIREPSEHGGKPL